MLSISGSRVDVLKASLQLAVAAVMGCVLTQPFPAYADEMVDKAIRKGKWDIMLAPQYTLAKKSRIHWRHHRKDRRYGGVQLSVRL